MPANLLALIALPAFLAGPMPPAFTPADAWLRLQTQAVEAIEAGEPDLAKQKLTAARDRAERDGVPHLFFEKCMIDLAQAQFAHGFSRNAEQNYRRAYIVRAARLGESNPATADLLRDLAWTCAAQGKTELSLRMMQGVLDIQSSAYGPSDARLSETHAEIGVLHLDLGEPNAAETSFTQSFDLAPGDERAVQLWIVKALAGDETEANAFLDQYLAQGNTAGTDEWGMTLLGFLRGEVASETLLSTAAATRGSVNRSARQFDAHFCIGWRYLMLGESAVARDMFQICRNLTAGSAISRRLVSIDLDRIEMSGVEGMRVTNVQPASDSTGF